MTQEKYIFWSTVFFVVAWAVRLGLRYLVHIRPELKKWKLVQKWEKVIALVNQKRVDYGKNFPDEKGGMPLENIHEHLKEFCQAFGVDPGDVTAHRRKMKDNELTWTTLDSGEAGATTTYKIGVSSADLPEPEGD